MTLRHWLLLAALILLPNSAFAQENEPVTACRIDAGDVDDLTESIALAVIEECEAVLADNPDDDATRAYLAELHMHLEKMYSLGKEVPTSIEKGLYHLRAAAELGAGGAQFVLGGAYRKGWPGYLSQDHKMAVYWLRKAAEHEGQMFAQFDLADLYANGPLDIRNYEEAARWYRIPAEDGLSSAAAALGRLYEQGLGVEQSAETAALWYQTALDNHRSNWRSSDWGAVAKVRPRVALGRMYAEGRGVPQSRIKAVELFRIAAESGDQEAQGALRAMGETW
ncbi:tetratricopeptide repeat protein [Roseovarius sp. MMSF_3281]|uniref:tetratricopeptide repeat protein n=1 Tax=Roseovarius sp. MMSF_3281 TaxID=3046694 RepID=UPI00273FE468|nr:tetratricopeptide repeat protein [Roseovarius sp. MMSF_3281]